MDKIYIAVTMDCEPVRSAVGATQTTSGPLTYEDSARFIDGFAGYAQQNGFPVSFFIHPEVAQAHPQLFLDWEQKGACLGLHIHPYKINRTRYRSHFGALTPLEQTILLSEASAVWREAIGRLPIYFRPGTFSANDATFRILTELGFRGGSLSCPGRMYPDLYAVWTGAPLDPHYANEAFRLMEGNLDFVNLPLTVDVSSIATVNGRSFSRDLRPDYLEADYDEIAGNIVAQLQERNPVVPVMMVVTHNDNDFTNPQDRVCGNYHRSLQAVINACKKAGIEPVGATVESLCDLVREKIPRAAPEFVIGHASIQAGQ
jgi:peptidoglycan/xylan/chitin deacetylase (PgdA/CDA1 family)